MYKSYPKVQEQCDLAREQLAGDGRNKIWDLAHQGNWLSR